jgi:hypothetical protein
MFRERVAKHPRERLETTCISRSERPPRRRASPNPPSRKPCLPASYPTKKKIRTAIRSIRPNFSASIRKPRKPSRRTHLERLATRSSRRGDDPLFGQIRDPARRIKESDRGERPPHHRSRSRSRPASRGSPQAHRELAGGARPAAKIARGSDRHRKTSDRRAEHPGGGSSTHVLAAGFPPQAGDGGLRISITRRAGVVAVLGGSGGDISAVARAGSRCHYCSQRSR